MWPWWTYKNIHGAFWRPLTVLTHRLDYALWPKQAMLMHAHSVCWYALLAGLVGVLYRRVCGVGWVAGAAALLYAIDDARGMPVGFLANRNALIASVFGVCAILAHDSWRRRNWRPGALLAPAAFAASLLSGEFGIGALAFLVAHALVFEHGTIPRRCAIILPYLAILAAWRAAWHLSGAGIEGVGMYVDPLTEPARFIVEAMQRSAILLLGQWAIPPSDAFLLTHEFGLAWLHWAVAVCVLLPLAAAMWPIVRRDRVTMFYATGMTLAVVPVCATFPADRMLFFVGIGAFGVLARFLASTATSRSMRITAVTLVIVHAVIAPIGLLARSAMPVGPRRLMEQFMVPPITDPAVERQSVILVTARIVLGASYLPINQELAGLPVPAHVRFLAPYQPPVEIDRVDDRTLVVRPSGGYLKSAWDQLARNDRHPMSLGERVELTGMTAEVTAMTDDGRPAEATFRFERPLEDAAHRWLSWGPNGYEAFTPPGVGERVTIDLR